MAAVRTLVIYRSDKFPVGTAVKAFPGGAKNRHHEGKPSGSATEEETVAANGSLTFTKLEEGIWNLWAEVASANANMTAGNIAYVPPGLAVSPQPSGGILKERIAARRALAGV